MMIVGVLVLFGLIIYVERSVLILKKYKDKKKFAATANRTKKMNVAPKIMRGGIRL